jgi:hypothetical protein
MGAGRGLSRLLTIAAAAAALLSSPSCSSPASPAADSGADVGPGPDVDFISCADEPRAPPFQQGMQVPSAAGTYVVKLVRNTFTDASGKVLTEPPAKGVDVWTVEVDAAATQTPLDGLTIAVRPFMPDHGHGTTSVGVTPAGAGVYTISPLNLYMAGYWEVTLTITDPSAATPASDTAMLKICVPD